MNYQMIGLYLQSAQIDKSCEFSLDGCWSFQFDNGALCVEATDDGFEVFFVSEEDEEIKQYPLNSLKQLKGLLAGMMGTLNPVFDVALLSK